MADAHAAAAAHGHGDLEIPYTVHPRPDTGLYNGKLGIWLFLASEVMLFGALFSSLILIRTSATHWPRGWDELNVPLATVNTMVLIISSVTVVLAWANLRLGNFKLGRIFIGAPDQPVRFFRDEAYLEEAADTLASRLVRVAYLVVATTAAALLVAGVALESSGSLLADRGRPIGDFDGLIAAHAVTLRCTLVTNNVRHFARVPD